MDLTPLDFRVQGLHEKYNMNETWTEKKHYFTDEKRRVTLMFVVKVKSILNLKYSQLHKLRDLDPSVYILWLGILEIISFK